MRNFGLLTILLATLSASATAAVPAAALQQAGVPTLAPMLKRVLPGVVNIISEGESEMPDNPLLSDPFFRRFFDIPNQPQKTTAVGSGVIVDAKKGYIVTNHHMVGGANRITVRLGDDREFDARLVGSDPDTDVAVVEIQGKDLTAIEMADSDQLQVGDFAVAIGNPFGLRQTVTSGIISGLGRSGIGNKFEDFIQTDASINPGNSGGALINLDGELIGINTAILSRSGGNIGIGFAIPSNLVRIVMTQILEYGEVRHGQLGIVGQDLTPELAKAFDIKQTRGVVIAQVVADSAADKAGLKAGDVITAVNGREIHEYSQLRNAIGLLRVGDTVKMDVLRDGDTKTFNAKIIAAKELKMSADKLHPGLAGARFVEMTTDHPLSGRVEGVVVKEVEPGSPAARAGLLPGDVITSVNRRQVDSLASLQAAANPKNEQVLLNIRRGGGAFFVLIQ